MGLTARRLATNVTLPEPLLREARALNIKISKACEHGLLAEVARLRRARWLQDNRAAIDAWNTHIEQHGLPLEETSRGRFIGC